MATHKFLHFVQRETGGLVIFPDVDKKRRLDLRVPLVKRVLKEDGRFPELLKIIPDHDTQRTRGECKWKKFEKMYLNDTKPEATAEAPADALVEAMVEATKEAIGERLLAAFLPQRGARKRPHEEDDDCFAGPIKRFMGQHVREMQEAMGATPSYQAAQLLSKLEEASAEVRRLLTKFVEASDELGAVSTELSRHRFVEEVLNDLYRDQSYDLNDDQNSL